MGAGQMRAILTFQRPGEVSNEHGQKGQGVVDLASSVRAEVRRQTGREYMASAAEQSALSALIYVRVQPELLGLTSRDSARDLVTGEVFQLKSPPREIPGRRGWLELKVESLS